ncbi:hypothetical protein SNE40_003314 [Patella caerulea]|uniref:Apple domain-containing protein n=1 Tax=Patella caerulea TaxID=87958 RepID=A0AAN8K9I8_PATCE
MASIVMVMMIVCCLQVSQTSSLSNLPTRSIPGLNKGTVHSQDEYVWMEQDCIYLEPENITAPFESWTLQHKFNYRYQKCGENCTTPPPIGIRSAVPLGGVSTGSVELRADGSFHEWTLMNLSPVGGAKIQVFDEAFFGLRTTCKPYQSPNNDNHRQHNDEKNQSFVLRTHPPPGLPGVQSLSYTGLYPAAHLTVEDTRLPITVNFTAMSTYFVNDLNSSAFPAISFIFTATNPSLTDIVEASFMFNLPFGIQSGDQGRSVIKEAATDLECFTMCNQLPTCLTWVYDESNSTCTILTSINLNGFNVSKSSGLKGTWSINQSTQLKCLTLNRPGIAPPSGNISLCSNMELDGVTFAVADDIGDLWKTFSGSGQFNFSGTNAYGVHGAISVKMTLPPGQVVKIPITMSWFYPNRDFGDKVFGSWYQHLFSSSEDVAEKMLNGESANLGEQTETVAKLHQTFLGTQDNPSSVPIWLSDVLINSLSHIRSAFWVADGRWRQFEAFDCPNVDPVHNDGERHIPYIMIFPESVKNKMIGWAKSQLSNGMIPEMLQSINCEAKSIKPVIDLPGGRVMSDVSSMFIVYLLELYKWGNEQEFASSLWPFAKKAAEWHMVSAEKYGTLYRIQNTYDNIGLNNYDVATYNSAFHLLAMKAAEELASAMGDTDFATKSRKAFQVGQMALDKYLWNNTMGYYNSYRPHINMTEPNPGAIMTDCFYSQVLAHSAGLGDLVDRRRLSSHMNAELSHNDSPYGMIVQTGRYPYPGPTQDNAVWMMGNPNWASTQLRLGLDPEKALNVAKKSLDRYRTVINDLWNVAGVSGGIGYGIGGQPLMLSHYGYYMSSWHILLALSGQEADLPSGILTFEPKIPAPFNYPVMLPGVLGTISSSVSDTNITSYTLTLMFGQLKLKHLGVGKTFFPGNVSVKAEESILWS